MPSSIGLIEAWRPDFGDCLFAAIDRMLRVHNAAVVLNSDSPTLPTSLLVEAARALARPGDRVVIGPSTDGGYYLLGVKARHRALFEDDFLEHRACDVADAGTLHRTRDRVPCASGLVRRGRRGVPEAAAIRAFRRTVLRGATAPPLCIAFRATAQPPARHDRPVAPPRRRLTSSCKGLRNEPIGVRRRRNASRDTGSRAGRFARGPGDRSPPLFREPAAARPRSRKPPGLPLSRDHQPLQPFVHDLSAHL